MSDAPKTMGAWEALWAIVGGLLLAAMIGLGDEAWFLLIVVVVYFACGAFYWKMRLARQRRRRRV